MKTKKHGKNKFASQSISRRWVLNHLGLVFLVLVVIDVVAIFALKNYFYNNAKQYLSTKLSSVTTILKKYSEDENINFSTELQNTVESFSDKDRMELMAIGRDGEVTVTSSGFSPESDERMPDYEQLMSTGVGTWVGKISGSEKVIAVSVDISAYGSEYSVVRVVSSMSLVDKNLRSLAFSIIAVTLGIFLLIVFTGLYFINSILKPILDINRIANKFAMGNFKEKINVTSEDELGQLGSALNKMASALENADAMKNEFISSVSHELKTPLTAIKGWAETVSYDDVDKDMMKKGIRIIISESNRLSEMVEELLDFSRMQTGHFSLSYSLVDILAELEDAVLIYSQKAKKDQIEVIYKAPENLPLINGDKNRIRQVFINVIDNAIKYSDPKGCVTVEAGARNGKIEVVVNDMGCGVSAEDLPKIKTKFYRANLTRRGSGIGLAVANEIIEMHKGSLNITSKEGVGTTVVISIPYDTEK